MTPERSSAPYAYRPSLLSNPMCASNASGESKQTAKFKPASKRSLLTLKVINVVHFKLSEPFLDLGARRNCRMLC